MALVYRATLHPTKLELLAEWLPTRSWYTEPAGTVDRVAAYRFDDPAGAVGVETLLVRHGDGPIYQVPLTYRDAPLEGAEESLLGTAEHSVLGRRWIYDACADPVYVTALADAIAGRVAQAEELVDVDGEPQRREPSMHVAAGTGDGPPAGAIERVVDGDPTVIVTATAELAVVRRLTGAVGVAGAALTGTWDGEADPHPLAYATVTAG